MEILEHTRARTLADVAKHLKVSKVAVWKWKDKGWIVYDADGMIDIAATAAMVDANRDAFVGGKPDRGIEPKPNLSDQLRPATAATAKSKGQTRTRIGKQRRGNEHLPEDIQSPVVCEPVERLDAAWTSHHGSAVSVQPLATDPTCEEPGVADPGFVPYVEARRRREVAEAEIAEIRARTMAGELISREAAEAAFVAVATAVRTGIEGVVGAVADQLVGMSTPAEVRAVLRPALEQALSELSEAPNVD